MTAFLPEDEAFSNLDSKAVSAPGHGDPVNPSGGARFAKNAWRIEILESRDPVAEWVIKLRGTETKNLSRTEFETLGLDFRVNGTYDGTEWSGVPLWVLVGLVDGEPRRGEGSFNATLARRGYELRLSGERRFSLTSDQIAANDSVVVVDIVSDTWLDDGPILSTHRELGSIDEVMTFPLWKTQIKGAGSVEVLLTEIMEMERIDGVAGYVKSSGAVAGPFGLRGVPLVSVLELAGELPGNYTVEVKAADGYSLTLTMAEVWGDVSVYDDQGRRVGLGGVQSVLYFEEEGTLGFEGGPLRLAYVGNDVPITEARYWVKRVNQLTIQPETD
jgi:hypothetical protein